MNYQVSPLQTQWKKTVALLTREQEYALIRAAKIGDEKALATLCEHFLPFVSRIAKRYGGGHDRVSDGYTGFVRAIFLFDESKGNRLSTYAYSRIKERVVTGYEDDNDAFKHPTSPKQKKVALHYRKAFKKVTGHEQFYAYTADILAKVAKDLGVKVPDIMEAAVRNATGAPISLDSLVSGTEGVTWHDSLAVQHGMENFYEPRDNQEESLAAFDEIERQRAVLQQGLGVLTDRERRVLEARKLCEEPLTLEMLSEELGVSRERVRQIEVRALEKLAATCARIYKEAVTPRLPAPSKG